MSLEDFVQAIDCFNRIASSPLTLKTLQLQCLPRPRIKDALVWLMLSDGSANRLCPNDDPHHMSIAHRRLLRQQSTRLKPFILHPSVFGVWFSSLPRTRSHDILHIQRYHCIIPAIAFCSLLTQKYLPMRISSSPCARSPSISSYSARGRISRSTVGKLHGIASLS